MTRRSLALPLVLCSILVGAVLAVTAIGWGFRGPERPLPMPEAIAAPDGLGGTGELSFRTAFAIPCRATGVSIVAACSAQATLRLDDAAVGSATGGPPATIRSGLSALGPGEHSLELRVAATDRASPVLAAALTMSLEDGGVIRVVTSSDWTVARTADPSLSGRARVAGDHLLPQLGDALSSLPRTFHEPKPPIFWATLGCLLGAIVIASLAGPIIRPVPSDPGIGPAVGLAAIVPSFLYASAAFLITGIAGLGASVPWVLGLHVAALAVFMLVLTAVGAGGAAVTRDHIAHKAELAGYDAMMSRMDMVMACVRGLPAQSRGDWVCRIESAAERVRCSATSVRTADLDRAIIAEIEGLERCLTSGGPPDLASCIASVDRIESMLLRREAMAASAQRIA